MAFLGRRAPFAPIIAPPVVVTAGISGTASITEADDTLSSAGTVLVQGSFAVTEADDTLVSAGTVLVSGSSSITESADTLSAAGTVLVSGTASITEADDSLSAAGTVLVSGAAAITEADDTLSSAGTSPNNGAAAVTEDSDTLSASGTVPNLGSASITEGDDTLSAAGFNPASGAGSGAAVGTFRLWKELKKDADAKIALPSETSKTLVATSASSLLSGTSLDFIFGHFEARATIAISARVSVNGPDFRLDIGRVKISYGVSIPIGTDFPGLWLEAQRLDRLRRLEDMILTNGFDMRTYRFAEKNGFMDELDEYLESEVFDLIK